MNSNIFLNSWAALSGLPTYEDAISQLYDSNSIKSNSDSFEEHIEIRIRNRKMKQVVHAAIVAARLRRISLNITQD